MAYNYGPPPPPPSGSAPQNSPASYPPSYGQPYPQRGGGHGGHSGRGRGGGGQDRGGFSQPAPPAYNYGQHPAAPYGAQPQPPYAGSHPQQPQQQQGNYQTPQHWPPEHSQHPQHGPQPPSHPPLHAQNYHPNYAPQIYQQSYGGQPPYPQAPQPPYGQVYAAPVPQPSPPAQAWGGHPQPPQSQNPYGGGGRGGRAYNERGGGSSQLMGPPIRIGFDGNSVPQPPPAPVSGAYPPQPYGAPHGPPAPYPPAPYQGYPPPAPYVPGSAPYERHPNHGARQNNRGGFHNAKSRGQFGGDKMRNRNAHGANAQTTPTHHQKPDAASAGKKKKRKTNTLGLTPGDESDEDDENEEERLKEMYGDEAPNPTHPTDIQNWIAERRANFPTKAKIELKKKTAEQSQASDATKATDNREAQLEKQKQKAEKLRKQLEKVESSIKRKREQQDEGDEMRDIDLTSSPSSDSKSDDEKPEVMSTRQEPDNLPPPPKKADPTKHCKYYSTGGTCGKRGKCRFVHDPAVREAALKEREMNGGRMTLQQRLILNDKAQEDLTIMETLKYLGDKGILKKELTAKASRVTAAKAEDGQNSAPQSQLPQAAIVKKESPINGLPPIPPPSAVSNNPAVKYPGWNLGGYGSTGVVRPGET